ncbi:hypothetical protein ID866_10822 [Astraeus odoratus]|nr:hypothetical protein ID866_10822 [Astraeus odoratus]
MITERVPIIPRFLPTHVGAEEPYVPFHEVFDILRLSEALRMPILEWDEVKDVNSSTVDELGCWAVWPTIYTQGTTGPRRSRNLAAMNLDVSYTVVPSWVRLSQPSANHGSLWSLARLSFPEGREDAKLDDLLNLPSPGNQVSLPPDDHLLCFDLLYYMGVDRPFEWERDYSPGWRFVGKYMHWNSTLEQLAEEHVRRALDIADREPTPPYIAVHVRHGDFKAICGDHPAEECFAPLPVIARRVAEVQEELLDRKGINVTNVIIASDEQDPNWWADVRALGWTWIDYEAEGTVEKYGKWYPVFLDSIMLSNAAGFVGTDHSTFSFLALRRVQYWNDGAVRTVRFGSPGADNH